MIISISIIIKYYEYKYCFLCFCPVSVLFVASVLFVEIVIVSTDQAHTLYFLIFFNIFYLFIFSIIFIMVIIIIIFYYFILVYYYQYYY